ncbi:hypothetical protein EVAR_17550_1 [Eumeta japonica]|uniref:Uncharacterized protein n=1 Tax=Eumeta variegata TaxID=151549 RepID=A0A4C1WTW2_EUMVA|nr:hypothetical protein EVAR_17550_1 [Eumeta japonica]
MSKSVQGETPQPRALGRRVFDVTTTRTRPFEVNEDRRIFRFCEASLRRSDASKTALIQRHVTRSRRLCAEDGQERAPRRPRRPAPIPSTENVSAPGRVVARTRTKSGQWFAAHSAGRRR